MDLNISTGLDPNARYNNSAAAHTLEEFRRQLSQVSDPFELCLQTLPLDVFSPRDGRKTDRNWSTFRFPMFSGYGFNVLKVFSEWFLSLNEQTRTLVLRECIQQPIVSACTESLNLPSLCRLISLLHLQPQFSPQLCLIPVVIAGAANYFLHCCEYLDGCDQPQLVQLSRELRKLRSDQLQLSHLAEVHNFQVNDCRMRLEQCLDRCSKILLQRIPVQLSFDDADWFSHLTNVKGGRHKVVELLCHSFFPNASDPFALMLEVFNIMRGGTVPSPSLAHFRLPKTGRGTLGMVVIDTFSHWFHSLDDASKTHLVDSFIREHIQAACSEGNFASMCRLVTDLRLQQYEFEPEMFLIPIQIRKLGTMSGLVTAYFEGCHKALVERFATQLDALLLPINEDEFVEFSRKCGVTPPLSQHALAKSIAGYKKRYRLGGAVVPNTLAMSAGSSDIYCQVSELWLEKNGSAKLIESLTQTHFPNATDPFALCLQLLNSAQSLSKFRYPAKQSGYSATVIEAFRIWLQSLKIDKRDHVFNEFIKQPILDACRSGNSMAMCRLLTKLDLYEKFRNEEDIFQNLIPIQLQRRPLFQCTNPIPKSLDHDSMSKQGKEASELETTEESLNLISSSGPWKHLSPPQRMIELFKKNTQIKR